MSALGLNLGLPKVLDVPVDSCGWAEASLGDGTFKTICCGMLIADEDSFE